MRFGFIDEHRGQFPVWLMCRVLRVSRSGFYAWRGKEKSPLEKRRLEILVKIRDIHESSGRRYGSPRVHAQLKTGGVRCNVKTVAKIMKKEQIRVTAVLWRLTWWTVSSARKSPTRCG